MNDDDFFSVLFIGAVGMYCLLATFMEWKFFFNSRQVKFLERFMSRKTVRIFWAVIGLGFLGLQ